MVESRKDGYFNQQSILLTLPAYIHVHVSAIDYQRTYMCSIPQYYSFRLVFYHDERNDGYRWSVDRFSF